MCKELFNSITITIRHSRGRINSNCHLCTSPQKLKPLHENKECQRYSQKETQIWWMQSLDKRKKSSSRRVTDACYHGHGCLVYCCYIGPKGQISGNRPPVGRWSASPRCFLCQNGFLEKCWLTRRCTVVAKNFNSPSLAFFSSGQDELDEVMRDISSKSCDPCFPAGGGGRGGPFKSQHVYDYLEQIDLIALETYMLTRLALLWAICHSGGLNVCVCASVSVYLHITCLCVCVCVLRFRFIQPWMGHHGLCTFAWRMQWLTAYYCCARWKRDRLKYVALEILQPAIDADICLRFSQQNHEVYEQSHFHINPTNVPLCCAWHSPCVCL